MRLSDPLVSGEHASIWWDGSDWCVRDLASRNGTYVDGVRLEPGQTRAIDPGTVLGFGKKDGWSVADVHPPVASATARGGTRVEEVDGFLCLPDADDPSLILFRGPMGRWQVDENGETRPLEGTELRVAGVLYRLDLPQAFVATMDAGRGAAASEVGLRFGVSLDEEHVQVEVRIGSDWQKLKPRAHHYLLLTLARLSLADADSGPEQRGWVHVDDLCKMVGLRMGLLNMQVLRIRREFEGLGVRGAAELVERRPLSSTLRLAELELEVNTLA
ncbi:MAG: FHA domain-containing protein [Proteobacteria bacterium]|nr:FHA domain-containing protein [Pseudomonadota bacterium]